LQYKPFLLFLGKFIVSYLILTVIYQSYLNRFDVSKSEVDSFTQSLAKQTTTVLSWFDSQSYILPDLKEPSIKIIYHNKYVSRIIEGCNALSVIILFIAFVIAFTGKFKHTVVFIFLGSALIHVLNVGRIVLLSIALYYYPQYEQLLHGIVFPLIIYGVVFLLWVIWVNKFSLHATAIKKK
jgi:exosortase family protein XrtF